MALTERERRKELERAHAACAEAIYRLVPLAASSVERGGALGEALRSVGDAYDLLGQKLKIPGAGSQGHR